MDWAHAVCPGCPVYPLSSFLIGASSQFQETSERMADEEERILQLVELLARTRIRIMKSDDCPHGSAPIVLDLPPNAAVPYGGDNLLSTGLSIFWSDIGQMSQGRCPEAAWRRSGLERPKLVQIAAGGRWLRVRAPRPLPFHPTKQASWGPRAFHPTKQASWGPRAFHPTPMPPDGSRLSAGRHPIPARLLVLSGARGDRP